MTKTIQILISTIILFSCGQTNEQKTSDKKVDVNYDSLYKAELGPNPIGGFPECAPGIIKIDSVDQKAFWSSVALPILKRDKEIVLTNMSFPISGDWTFMMQLDIQPDKATKEDFAKVYDKFFNSDFTKALSSQTYSDIAGYKNSDTTWFTISLGRSYGEYEGGLMLEYIKVGDKYRLTTVHGAGANFYDMD